MNNVLVFPNRLRWERAQFPPLLKDRVRDYSIDLAQCIETMRKARNQLAGMSVYDRHSEEFAIMYALAHDTHEKLKRMGVENV